MAALGACRRPPEGRCCRGERPRGTVSLYRIRRGLMETMDRAVNRRQELGSETPDLIPGYFARIDKGSLLTHEEEIDLSKRAKAGDDRARKKLVEKNLRLVVSVAKRYRGMGLPFEDLIQE